VDPQALLDNMVRTIKMSRDMMTAWKFGTAVPSPGKQFPVLHPEFVMELNRKGFTGKKLQEYLHGQTLIPYEQLKRVNNRPDFGLRRRRVCHPKIKSLRSM